MSLGQILRDKREELGMTLDEVSRICNCSKPYLSTVETNKVKNPPSDDLLRKLENVLEFDSGSLVHMAHLQKLPADVRQSFEDSRAENDQLRHVIHQAIHEGKDIQELVQSMNLQQYFDQPLDYVQQHAAMAGRLVPVINKVPAGYPVDFDDMGYPPGSADDYVRCPDLHDPQAFAVRVIGDSMEPKYREGDIIIFSPAAQVNNGDDCFVRMANPHETTFKRVYFEPDQDVIRLQPLNSKYSPITLPTERVNGVWKAVVRYEQLSEDE